MPIRARRTCSAAATTARTRCSRASTPPSPTTAPCCASPRAWPWSLRCTWSSSASRPRATRPGTRATCSSCAAARPPRWWSTTWPAATTRTSATPSPTCTWPRGRRCATPASRTRPGAPPWSRAPTPSRRGRPAAGAPRHELPVGRGGDRAELGANGVLLAGGRRHLDTRLGIQHIARDTRCDLVWRGMADGRARAVFHGGIEIREGADGTDARLSSKNLLLAETAEIDTQPVLVIHADDVTAAHGATVGQLDAAALFYLRSRGVPAAEARALLTAAFLREPMLSVVEAPAHRELLQARLDRAVEAQAA